jgi:hypothetical protein
MASPTLECFVAQAAALTHDRRAVSDVERSLTVLFVQ